ncbi:carboxylate-amine ligase [Actinocorallia herbida]|uniref:Putative glutamate--cysteine ligase 2 n=1 Tax=Actinocorallia herbida TaxID=58109 RepID=A0A3N1CW10_9ACTN|nr:glutamate--cysteine ligase [Actinocorallia herbida]ROO85444.1 carboxylate-amine ligase [Actinocorallia herbida]
MADRPVCTVGVEEEFLLVDPESGETRGRGPEVLAAVADHGPRPPGGFHAELQATQVESATEVHTRLTDLRRDLVRGRGMLADAARAKGLVLISSGTPVAPSPDPPVAPGERFSVARRAFADVTRRYEVCGCHVHVGVPDRDTAVAVVGHLRPWLPTLLALSVNSPYDRGRDSGYASWRMIEQARFPGGGAPPCFRSAAEHDRAVDRLVACGILIDAGMTFWTARPSPRYPTVEVRAADACGTVDEAVLQAALARALVATALAELAAGREAVPVDPQICAAGQWNAARHGLAGAAVDPVEGRLVPARTRVSALLTAVRPALEEAGDFKETDRLLRRVLDRGTGAERQRNAGAAGIPAVLRMLAEQTSQKETEDEGET